MSIVSPCGFLYGGVCFGWYDKENKKQTRIYSPMFSFKSPIVIVWFSHTWGVVVLVGMIKKTKNRQSNIGLWLAHRWSIGWYALFNTWGCLFVV